MHLLALRLRGFKSFPDPVELRLEPGVAVVVGPNGSGKSNLADAIVWAAGSLAPSELRAEKPDDVLFAGGAGRPAAPYCEVELRFDNEDGSGPIEFSELAIARRLHRGGEGQYLVNGASVRRTDVVELLADVGLGPGMHSIVGQGRVEEILASKPEDRRALVEEAAGLGRFKSRRHRAELKLARVATQVERARDLETEMRARLRPLALQASAAERAERLGGEIAGLRAALAAAELGALEERLAEVEERRAAVALERRTAQARLEQVLADRARAEEELAGAAGRREEAIAALYRLRSAGERVELRRESAGRLAEALVATRSAPDDRTVDDAASEELAIARERLAALERALADREGVAPAARALAKGGERLAIDTVAPAPGDERAVAAALGWRASAVLAADPAAGLALLQRAREAGLGSLAVVVDRPDLLAGVSIVERNELLEARSLAVTREGFAYDPERGELWFVGEAAEAVQLELDSRRRELAERVRELEAHGEAPARRTKRRDPARLARLAGLAERLDTALAGADDAAARYETPLRARLDAGAERASRLAGTLRELGAAEAELRHRSGETSDRAAAVDVERARLDAEAAEARRRLDELGVEPPELDGTPAELSARLERLERRREELGRVNPLAREDYERERERLDDLVAQRDDLERSLVELDRLRNELAETVDRRFAETYAAVERHFREVAATLFPGGEGRLELAGDGVEVELRPAGKRITRLSLLSGGERALGAIAFLFALFLARPCPFYLLDEVEAALDDTNIGRFVELLRRFAGRAQFVVVTHQKRTMEAADTLYGVTMGTDGISQVVSRRVPRALVATAAG